MRNSRLSATGACGLALIAITACSAGQTSQPSGSAPSASQASGPGSSGPGSSGPGGSGSSAGPGQQPASPAPGAAPHISGALTPAALRSAYDVGPLLRRGIDGKGQTIVIIDPFGSPTIAHDLAVYDRQFGLPAPPSFKVIQPAGPVPAFQPTSQRIGAAGETTLDVESAHVMAPGANILLVETPTAEIEGRTGFPEIVTAEEYVIRHHLGDVISQSFGATEQTFASPAAIRQLRGDYLLAAQPAHRVTVLASTGDVGAAGLTYSTKTVYPHPAVGWPASDPLVTAVGGTELGLDAGSTRRHLDVVWTGSGGGRSTIFARPSYQRGVAAITGPHRGIPDISMAGSCASGLEAYGLGGDGDKAGWFGACGTSLSSPLFAGIVAMAAQQAGHSLGLINPALYKMAAAHARGLVDVLQGSNSFSGEDSRVIQGFTAQVGYDLASGLGTVDAAYFVPELAKRAG